MIFSLKALIWQKINMPALKGIRTWNAYTVVRESSRRELCIGQLQIRRRITEKMSSFKFCSIARQCFNLGDKKYAIKIL